MAALLPMAYICTPGEIVLLHNTEEADLMDGSPGIVQGIKRGQVEIKLLSSGRKVLCYPQNFIDSNENDDRSDNESAYDLEIDEDEMNSPPKTKERKMLPFREDVVTGRVSVSPSRDTTHSSASHRFMDEEGGQESFFQGHPSSFSQSHDPHHPSHPHPNHLGHHGHHHPHHLYSSSSQPGSIFLSDHNASFSSLLTHHHPPPHHTAHHGHGHGHSALSSSSSAKTSSRVVSNTSATTATGTTMDVASAMTSPLTEEGKATAVNNTATSAMGSMMDDINAFSTLHIQTGAQQQQHSGAMTAPSSYSHHQSPHLLAPTTPPAAHLLPQRSKSEDDLDDATTWLRTVRRQIENGHYSEASSMLEEVITDNKYSAAVWVEYASVKHLQDEIEKKIDALKHVVNHCALRSDFQTWQDTLQMYLIAAQLLPTPEISSIEADEAAEEASNEWAEADSSKDNNRGAEYPKELWLKIRLLVRAINVARNAGVTFHPTIASTAAPTTTADTAAAHHSTVTIPTHRENLRDILAELLYEFAVLLLYLHALYLHSKIPSLASRMNNCLEGSYTMYRLCIDCDQQRKLEYLEGWRHVQAMIYDQEGGGSAMET